MKPQQLPLALPADAARRIVEACQAKPAGKDSAGRVYANMEDVNAAYHNANGGSYEGFRAALAYGERHGLFHVHPSGARVYLAESGYVAGSI